MLISNEVKLDFDDVLMVPQRSTLSSREEVELERKFLFYHSPRELTVVPIFCSNMTTVATFEMATVLSKFKMITCLHKYYSCEELCSYFNKSGSIDYNWVSIGYKGNDLDKLKELADKGVVPNIVIDVPNGHMQSFVSFCNEVRHAFPVSIICAGNVCTPEMTQELIIHGGVDIVKLQIGPGAACTTRKMTGVGYGTLSCVIECAHVAHGLKYQDKRLGLVCSDGGCRYPGDVCKALGANADFVMLGSYFAGTDECDPEEWVYDEDNQKKSMLFYGMSTHYAQEKYAEGRKEYRASEGAMIDIPYKGPVRESVLEMLGGIRSSCSYIGADSVKNMGKCAKFIRVSKIHQDF